MEYLSFRYDCPPGLLATRTGECSSTLFGLRLSNPVRSFHSAQCAKPICSGFVTTWFGNGIIVGFRVNWFLSSSPYVSSTINHHPSPTRINSNKTILVTFQTLEDLRSKYESPLLYQSIERSNILKHRSYEWTRRKLRPPTKGQQNRCPLVVRG